MNKNIKYSSISGLKIIIVLSNFELGGAERQALLLAKYLKRNGHANAEICGFSEKGKIIDICKDLDIKFHPLPYPMSSIKIRRVFRLYRFNKYLKKLKPDVILPYTSIPNISCGAIWKDTGAKLCIWNQRDEGRDLKNVKYIADSINNTPLFISNSNHGAEYIIKKFNVSNNKVHVIFNGVELPRPQNDRETWRKMMGISDECILACMVANLSRYKDHITLLKAWSIVVEYYKDKNREVILALAGRHDDSYPMLIKFVTENKLEENVKFLGQVSDISGLLAASDFGVFSSNLEGTPNGVLECMASRLAVVATDIPGIRNAIGDQGSNLLCTPHDASIMASKIIYIIENSQIRKAYAESNYKRIKEVYSPESMYNSTVEVILKGLNT